MLNLICKSWLTPSRLQNLAVTIILLPHRYSKLEMAGAIFCYCQYFLLRTIWADIYIIPTLGWNGWETQWNSMKLNETQWNLASFPTSDQGVNQWKHKLWKGRKVLSQWKHKLWKRKLNVPKTLVRPGRFMNV